MTAPTLAARIAAAMTTDNGTADALANGDGTRIATLEQRSARRIAAAIGRMINHGELAVGTRLPTVRELSRQLGVSPTTVSEAWRTLADVGAIQTRGRNGTIVREPAGRNEPRRYHRVTEHSGAHAGGHLELDLSTGTPDPALLPDLSPVIARVSRQTLTSSYLDRPVLPELEASLRASWPFDPEAITVVDGALDALDRVAQAVLSIGDTVVVEHPTFPPLLDLLEQLGCTVIGIDVDDEGLRAEAIAGLDVEPAAIFLQPRAQNPSGVTLSARRAAEIGAIVAGTETLVIEDDHANDISTAPLASVGVHVPERTVHIRSFSKSHGPDLRLAAIGGAGDVVLAVANRRRLGPGWSSRILQALLVELLADPTTAATLRHATATYTHRRAVVAGELARRGVTTVGSDGINLWVGVDDERTALVRLAARGISAAPGQPFQVRDDADFLRVTVGLITGDDERLVAVAGIIADAALTAARPTNTYR